MIEEAYRVLSDGCADSGLPEDRLRLLREKIDYGRRMGKISIIIVTRDRRDALRDYAMKSILGLDFDKSMYEVIVVDNNSDDETLEYLRSLKLENLIVVREAREGICFARNAGIRASSGDVVVFTDDDCSFDRDWMKRIHAFYNEPGSRYLLGQGYIFDECYKKVLNRDNPQRLEMRFAAGNFSCRREVFDYVNYNENIIFGWDEYDLMTQVMVFWPDFRYYVDETPIRHHRAKSKYFIDRTRSKSSPNNGFSEEGLRVTKRSRVIWLIDECALKRNLRVDSALFGITFFGKELFFSIFELPLISFDVVTLYRIKLRIYAQLMRVRSLGRG
jgi:glycosyltransferase involved in cell wall biosynthesis